MGIDQNLLYAPCPCGSGLKFKFCCYRSVRDELPPHPTQAEVTMAVRRFLQPFGMINDVDPLEDRKALELMRKGCDKRDEGKFDEALALFRQARDERPKIHPAWNNEALCLWFCGRFAEAVAAQEKGLELSGDVNAFGWAQLSQMRYFLGDDPGAADAIDKAAAMAPLSDDAATKVCSVLALLRRHGQVLSYARSSGFDQTRWVAFYAGMAALNLGDRATAVPLLETAARGEDATPFAIAMHVAASNAVEDPGSPSGEWPYFDEETYGAGPMAVRALAVREPQHRNVVCDLVEIMLCMRELDKKAALEILEPYQGGRAEILRAGLAKTHHFDTTALDDGEPEGDQDGEEALKILGEADPGHECRRLDMEVVPGGELDDPEDDALFRQAGADWRAGKPGGKRWERAKRAYRKILKRHPDFFRAEFNLAAMSEQEGHLEEADVLLAKVAAEHPEYAFAQAALVRRALQQGDVARAGRIVETCKLPTVMNPIEYRAWLRAARLYYEKVGDDVRAGNTADAIKEIEKAFDL